MHTRQAPISTASAVRAMIAGLVVILSASGVVARNPREGYRPGADPLPLNLPDPPAIKGLTVVEKLGERIPLDLPFTDSDGQPMTIGQLFGDGHKPVVLALVYFRCPMQCPFLLNRLNQRLNQLDLSIGKDYNVAVVSFDPSENAEVAARQKIQAISNYNRPETPRLEASWRFLTGPGESSRQLARAVGFPFRYLPDSNEYSHPTAIFVLTPDGTVSRYLYGLDYPTDRLRMALLEASNGRIGSSWDKLVLWCYHFDPNSGEYVVAAFRIMQGATLAMIAAMVAFLGSMWLVIERRRRPWSPVPVVALPALESSTIPAAPSGGRS